jgi:putative ABC transport system permease protein
MDTFRLAHDRARARGRVALAWRWCVTLVDLVSTAIAERRFGHRLPFDLRLAVRSLIRTPGFTAAAIVTLALGLGMNVAVMSVVDRITFRPLPYGDADRLVHIRGASARRTPSPRSFLSSVVPPAVAANAPGFEDVALAEGGTTPVTLDDGSSLSLDTVSGNLLRVLRVTVAAGRDFMPEDASPGFRDRTVLLGFETWGRRFGRSDEVFRSPLTAGRVTYRVVGILPPGFFIPSSSFDGRPDGVVLEPLQTAEPAELGPAAIGRLREGVSVAQAQAQVDIVMERLKQEHPDSILTQWPSIRVQELGEGLFEFYRPYAWIVFSGVALVFLIGCINLATLFLARGRSREHDAAIQAALGASRGRVVRAFALEALVVCLLGAILAVGVCYATFELVLTIVPAALVAGAVSPVDPRLLMMTGLMALASATIAGVVPAWRASDRDVVSGLRIDRRSSTVALRGGATLLAVQAALGVVLVTGAAATVRSFAGIVLEYPGYRVEGLYDVRVQHGAPQGRPNYSAARVRATEAAVRGFPGVQAAGVTSRFLVGGGSLRDDPFWTTKGQQGTRVGIGSGLFTALGTPMLAGRDFTDSEVQTDAPVTIVNRKAAAQLWPSWAPGEVIGQTVTTPDGVRSVVGVAEDVRRLPGIPILAALFIPVTAREVSPSGSSLYVTVRVAAGASLDVTALDARLDSVFAPNNMPTTEVATQLPPYLQQPRFQAILFGSVAVVGLILSVAGLYAVAAFDVARRRRELGVRMALGATRADVRRLIVRSVVRPVAVGIAAGIGAAWWLGRFLQAFVFEVDARDPWTSVLVSMVLLATAVLGVSLPARRAANTDPSIVLRAQ